MNKMADPSAVDLTGAVWRTSSYTAGSGNCVEVAVPLGADLIAVRDTKDNGAGAVVRFTASQWTTFLDHACGD